MNDIQPQAETGTALVALTADEVIEREHHEQVIESVIGGIRQLSGIGDASLKVLRDKRLYRSTHGTFEDYCQERFGFTRIHVNRRIAFSALLEDLKPRGFKPLPDTEYQARPLMQLDTPGQQADAWTRAQAATGQDQPSAAAVAAAVQAVRAELEPAIATLSDETAKLKKRNQKLAKQNADLAAAGTDQDAQARALANQLDEARGEAAKLRAQLEATERGLEVAAAPVVYRENLDAERTARDLRAQLLRAEAERKAAEQRATMAEARLNSASIEIMDQTARLLEIEKPALFIAAFCEEAAALQRRIRGAVFASQRSAYLPPPEVAHTVRATSAMLEELLQVWANNAAVPSEAQALEALPLIQ